MAKRYSVAKHQSAHYGLGFSPLSTNEEIRRDLLSIKRASRKAGNDDGYVVRFLGMCDTHIVGPEGFKYQSKAELRSGKPDKRAQKLIEKNFEEWAKRGNCDVTGQYSWQDIQSLYIRSVAEDGELLVRMVEGFPNDWGFAVQLLDSAHLDLNYNRQLKNGHEIVMGVEIDNWKRPIAYHVLTNHPGERTYYNGKTRYERIPAEEIMLGYLPFRVGQLRGVPWAHAALLEMNHLYGYREAEMIGARLGASKKYAYEADAENLDPDDSEEAYFEEEVEPGEATVVPYGYTLKELNFTHPGSNFGAFMKEGKRGAASGLDVNYNTLANDLEGVNFSSLRHAVLEDRDSWKKKQRWMRQSLCDQVAPRLLKMSMLMGKLAKLAFSEYDRLNKHKFQGRRWDWVDPLKDEKANTEGLKNKTRSPMQIIRDRGDDPEDVVADIVEFETLLATAREKAHGPKKPNQPKEVTNEQSSPETEAGAEANGANPNAEA
ncbi:phage portal protein [Vibrio coralliilyticus]|uniref:phage portal protein n=1 Tax=Vibrio coralliilyticus TaxID=190893 RepID=UPI00068FE7B1|nr:phage portal protein [Vibrio coralliilyticus]NOH41709.1 phage portal protein [Vibrio coralliilyticus]